MEKRVVITGLGPLCASGEGTESFWKALLSAERYEKAIPLTAAELYDFSSRFHVPAPAVNLQKFGVSPMHEKMMSPETRLAVQAAFLALQDAGLGEKRGFGEDAGVCFGIGLSSLSSAFDSYTAHLGLTRDGVKAKGYNRMIIPMTMTNACAAWVSILCGLNGGSMTVNASCASGTAAIGEAWHRIRRGECSMMICGGTEAHGEETGGIMRGFDMIGALTKSEDGNPRPFSKQRSGFLFCDGAACALVIEEAQSALNRGAKIYCEITDYVQNSDAYSILQIDPSGERIESLYAKLAKNRTISYINTHGTGTSLNDSIEASAITRIFGEGPDSPLIGATKGLLGHSIGASGALEAAATALVIKNNLVPGMQIPDPLPGLNLPAENSSIEIAEALSVSFGFGGHNAGLAFKAWQD